MYDFDSAQNEKWFSNPKSFVGNLFLGSKVPYERTKIPSASGGFWARYERSFFHCIKLKTLSNISNISSSFIKTDALFKFHSRTRNRLQSSAPETLKK